MLISALKQTGLGAILGLVLFACGKQPLLQPIDPDNSQLDYFPLAIGKKVEFQVDSIIFDFAVGGGTIQDSSSTFLREIVTDTFRDQTGQLNYVIERYERQSMQEPWTFNQASYASISSTQAILTEQNWRFLKLVFPMDRRTAWDGNIWIDKTKEIEIAGERMRPFTNWNYEIDSIDIESFVGKFKFDSTLVVTEADDSNVIERRFSRVRYAKHIGLVWREQWILDSQYCNQIPAPLDCASRPWEQKAEKGYILRQTILSFN